MADVVKIVHHLGLDGETARFPRHSACSHTTGLQTDWHHVFQRGRMISWLIQVSMNAKITSFMDSHADREDRS